MVIKRIIPLSHNCSKIKTTSCHQGNGILKTGKQVFLLQLKCVLTFLIKLQPSIFKLYAQKMEHTKYTYVSSIHTFSFNLIGKPNSLKCPGGGEEGLWFQEEAWADGVLVIQEEWGHPLFIQLQEGHHVEVKQVSDYFLDSLVEEALKVKRFVLLSITYYVRLGSSNYLSKCYKL